MGEIREAELILTLTRTEFNPEMVAAATKATIVSDPYSDYSTFLHASFDSNDFAHAVVNNEPYPVIVTSNELTSTAPITSSTKSTNHSNGFMKGLLGNDGGRTGDQGGGDVGAALARLNFGVEDLNRQLKSEITKHHSVLLVQAASLGSVAGDLAEVRHGLAEVESGVVRLRRKITAPHTSLSDSLSLLTRLQRAASLARRASRFTVLARRLEIQMIAVEGGGASGELSRTTSVGEGLDLMISDNFGLSRGDRVKAKGDRRDRAMAEAALTLAEIQTLLEVPEVSANDQEMENDHDEVLPIRDLQAIAVHIPLVDVYRRKVVETMEEMVERGLNQLDNPLLSSSLQIAHNLSVLPTLVQGIVAELNDYTTKKIKACFDMQSLGREMNKDSAPTSAAAAFVYKSRARNEPTNVTMPLWSSAMWSRLDALLSDIGRVCIKVYTLEKVLQLKRDQITQNTFLEEAIATMDSKPSTLFWTNTARELESASKDSARSSTFLQTIFASGYPRLLRLFQEFFEHVSTVSGAIYSMTKQTPEAILLLRSIQPFESLYLTRTTNRLNESISSAFSLSSSSSNTLSLPAAFTGSSRGTLIPTGNEGQTTARLIVNELDKVRFDPLLIKAVARGAARGVEGFVTRCQGFVLLDYTANSISGPLATPGQRTNASIASALYHLWLPLNRALLEHEDGVKDILKPSIDSIHKLSLSIATPLILAIRREFSTIITRMHRVDYSATNVGKNDSIGSSSSHYMTELNDKLVLVKDEILGPNWKVGELTKEWALDLCRFIIQTYLLHASLVTSLSESGKLLLTSDTTALEFSIATYLSSYSLTLATLGDQHKALRAFRPLLFLEIEELDQVEKTRDVPGLILLHSIIGRRGATGLQLPNVVKGWTEGEYVRWLNEHGEKDRIDLVEEVVGQWISDRSEAQQEVEVGNTEVVMVQEEKVKEEEFTRILKNVLARQRQA